MPTLTDLHTEMGRFLTESSHIENLMLSLVIATRLELPFEGVFVDFMGKTFGGKINAFKSACNAYSFGAEHRKILDSAYLELDALLPKRNFIVHGSTYEIGVGDKPTQPYRIGMTKGDAEFMNRALADGMSGPHVFTTDQVSAVSEECIEVRAKLASVATEIMMSLARKK